MLVRQCFDLPFDLLLLVGLRQRVKFAVGNDLRGHWRGKCMFRRFELREFSGTEVDAHGYPSIY
jgi:hypothetical protein